MKKSIVFLVLVVVFGSCEPMYKMKYENISEEMKPNLQNNDTVYFVNQQVNSVVDTFLIERYDSYLLYDRTRSLEQIYLTYRHINKQSANNINVHLLSANGIAVSGYTFSNNYETFDLEVNSIKYPVFTLKNTSPTTNTLPDSLYYSYKEGILRYFYSDTIYNRTF